MDKSIRERDRLQASVELVRMWRNLVVEDKGGVPRYRVVPGAALNQLVEWTDEFLRRPWTPE